MVDSYSIVPIYQINEDISKYSTNTLPDGLARDACLLLSKLLPAHNYVLITRTTGRYIVSVIPSKSLCTKEWLIMYNTVRGYVNAYVGKQYFGAL